MTTQSAFELRYQCLTLAQNTLLEQFNASENKDKKYPTTDEIFQLAERMNDFISGKPSTNKKQLITVPTLIPFEEGIKLIKVDGHPMEDREEQDPMFNFLDTAKNEMGIIYGRNSGVTTVTSAWSIAKCQSAYNLSICLVFDDGVRAHHAYGVVIQMMADSCIPVMIKATGKYITFANGSSITFVSLLSLESIRCRQYKEIICDARITPDIFKELERCIYNVGKFAGRVISVRSN